VDRFLKGTPSRSSRDGDSLYGAYQVGPVGDCLREPLEDVDGAGMGKVNSRVLTYRQMRDGAPLLEGIAERLCIDVVWVTRPGRLVGATSVEADVDVVHMAAERQDAGTVVPDTTKHNTPDGTGEGGVVCKGIEGARGLVGRVDVEGVIEERRSNAEELSGDKK